MSSPAAAPPPLLTRRFAALLLAQAGFGYAFSSFLLLPKFVAAALDGGPADVGRIETVHGLGYRLGTCE